MLSCLTLPKEYDSKLVEVDADGDRRILSDHLPGFAHFRAPVNVVKDQDGQLMRMWKQLPEVGKGRFVTVVAIQKGEVDRSHLPEHVRKRCAEFSNDRVDVRCLYRVEIFLRDAGCFRATFQRPYFRVSGRRGQVERGDPKRGAYLQYFSRLKAVDEAEQQLSVAT